MKTIRLSVKAGRELLRILDETIEVAPNVGISWRHMGCVESLRRALAPKPKKPSAKARGRKKRAKRDETAELRAQVEARAGGVCECGCGVTFSAFNPMEMDHFFGRGRAKQKISNVWGLTGLCHRLKHAGKPSPEDWHRRFARHAARHGYAEEVARASARLVFVQARAEMGRAG